MTYIHLETLSHTECDLPCDNGGTPDSESCSQCQCPSGYTGPRCEIDIDECSIAGSCFNGVCTDTAGGYTCVCFDGYEGTTCSDNVDDCEPNKCQNGATCQDRVANYECECRDHSSGENCELCDIDDCQSCNFTSDPIRCSQCQAGHTPNTQGLCGMF